MRQHIFDAIEKERAYQDGKWGHAFDDKNTPNDWIAYICQYATKAATLKMDVDLYRTALLKTAALCVAALEALDRTGTPPKRHYD